MGNDGPYVVEMRSEGFCVDFMDSSGPAVGCVGDEIAVRKNV